MMLIGGSLRPRAERSECLLRRSRDERSLPSFGARAPRRALATPSQRCPIPHVLAEPLISARLTHQQNTLASAGMPDSSSKMGSV